MAWDGEYFSLSYKAGENHNTEGHTGIAIALNDNLVAANGKEAGGILLPHSKPKSGELGSIGYMGALKFRAGAAVALNAPLTVTASGYLITATASGDFRVGRCVEAAASGGLGVGIFNFACGIYTSTSN